MKKFNKRIGNFEARSCDKHLLQKGKHIKIEIIKWEKCLEKEYCYALVVFRNIRNFWYISFTDNSLLIKDYLKINKLMNYVIKSKIAKEMKE